MFIYAPGTENFSFLEKLVYFFVSGIINRVDLIKERSGVQTEFNMEAF